MSDDDESILITAETDDETIDRWTDRIVEVATRALAEYGQPAPERDFIRRQLVERRDSLRATSRPTPGDRP